MNGSCCGYPERGWYEEAQTLAHGDIGNNYAELGSTSHPTRSFIINNFTDVHLWLSFDGNKNNLAIPSGGHYVQDTATNGFSLPKGTKVYIKNFTNGLSPTSGSVVLSVAYHGL